MRRIAPSVARVAWTFALVSGLTLAASGSAGARTAPTESGPRIVRQVVNVSKMSGNQAEIAVAVNPTNPDNVVIASNLETGSGLFKAYSMNGGRTWTKTVIGDGDNLGNICCDPTMSFDEFGNLFLAYLSDDDFGVVPVALSTDGGMTFDLLEEVGASSGATGASAVRGAPALGFVDQPTIVAAEGSVWVVFNSGSMEAAGAPVNGPGQVGGFSNPQTAPGTSGCTFGDIAIGPNGQVMQTCQTGSGNGPGTIYVNVDPDGLGGAGFGARVTVSSTNVGQFDYIPAQSGRSVDAEAGLAWDRTGGPRNGRVYLIYADEFPQESHDHDIFLRTSDDNGATWSAAKRVNNDNTTNSQFLPRIALDQTSGDIAVSFHDSRDDRGDGGAGDTNGVPNDDANFYITFSANGGVSFARNVRVSRGTSNDDQANNGVDYGDYTGLDFYAGNAHPGWADNSNSTGDNPDGTLNEFDVYSAKVRARA
ncbi:hypothetical protein BH20ACT24_BH20ACT24_12760 [soil metagenome]